MGALVALFEYPADFHSDVMMTLAEEVFQLAHVRKLVQRPLAKG
jgi:hypothetical protein